MPVKNGYYTSEQSAEIGHYSVEEAQARLQ